MITTMEYFKMSKEDLQKVNNEYGYTREENKILDSGLKVTFFNSIEEFKSIGADNEIYMKSFHDMDCTEVLLMTDNRIAVVYN